MDWTWVHWTQEIGCSQEEIEVAMNDFDALLEKLNKAELALSDALLHLGSIDKSRQWEEFSIGYEQGWIESASIQIRQAKDRIFKHRPDRRA